MLKNLSERVGENSEIHSNEKVLSSWIQDIKISEKKKVIPKFDSLNDKNPPCMENASGLSCRFFGCQKPHGSNELVTASLVNIGTKRCCRRDCNKNKTPLTMKNGKVITLCPDLHGDEFDKVKIELGNKWGQFRDGIISFDMIHNDKRK